MRLQNGVHSETQHSKHQCIVLTFLSPVTPDICCADKSSALKAIEMIHGQEVSGIRFKVMVADPQTNDTRKRPRTT